MPLQTQVIPAIVITTAAHINVAYEVKKIIAIESFPTDSNFLNFIRQIANYYQIQPLVLIQRFRKFIEQKNKTSPTDNLTIDHSVGLKNNLSTEQSAAFELIVPDIINTQYKATILHGVTGSGKTEVYKSLISAAIAQNKTAMLLLPEVALAIQFENIMRNSLDHTLIHGFHSASNAKQKRALWQTLITNQACLIIGVHLPILLPISNLGLIIVDEEHETGYQEKKHPRLNSKEIAIVRAHQYNIPIVLGSATPSISSLHNLQRTDWQKVTMPSRFTGAFPVIKLIQVTKQANQPHFLITKELVHSIQTRLDKKEQVIIFLNRRGYSFFVQCQACNFIFYCPNCAVSLTLHKDETLRCHYCDFRKNMPTVCSQCNAKKFLKKGVGTQQIVTILEKIFPLAKIARADLDATIKKRTWQATVTDFTNQKIDILVGTQTITKGYHFPGVTLVGILWADINLHLPIFNAAEVTLQQILQVAGRAGRQSQHSEVLVQTMSQHAIFNYLDENRYLDFYHTEIQKRLLTNYPPIIRLVEIELKHKNENTVETEIYSFFDELEKKFAQISTTIEILGPVKPVLSKLKNMHTRKIYLKSQNIFCLIALFKLIDLNIYQSKIFFTPNPLS